MSREFDYKQRATTQEYRENWDRVFGPKSPKSCNHTPEAAEPLARFEASGVPASKESAFGTIDGCTCACHFLFESCGDLCCKSDGVMACPLCGSKTYRTFRAAHNTEVLALCNGCGVTL
jgi:hypothetical protein